MSSIIKNNNRNLERGAGIVEIIIYISILVVVTFFVIQSVLWLTESHRQVSLNRDVEYSAGGAMETMLKEVREASSINSGASSFGSNPGTLFLNGVRNGVGYSVSFSVVDGVIYVSRDGSTPQAITSSSVSVSNLIFRTAQNTNSDGVKIEIEVSGSRGNYSKSVAFENFAVLRGSY